MSNGTKLRSSVNDALRTTQSRHDPTSSSSSLRGLNQQGMGHTGLGLSFDWPRGSPIEAEIASLRVETRGDQHPPKRANSGWSCPIGTQQSNQIRHSEIATFRYPCLRGRVSTPLLLSSSGMFILGRSNRLWWMSSHYPLTTSRSIACVANEPSMLSH